MLARNLARITLARSMGTPPQQQAPATGEQHGGSSSDNKQHASVTLPPGVAQTRVTLLYGSYASPDVGVHQNYICFTAAEIDAIVTLVLKGRTGDLTEGRVRACLADFLGEGRGEVIVVPINCPIREPYYGPYRIHTRGTFSYRRERPQDRRAYAVPLFDFDLRLHKRYKEHPFYISYRSSKDNQLHLLAISIAKFTLAKDKALAKAASQSEVNKAMLEWLARLKTAFVKLDKTLEDFDSYPSTCKPGVWGSSRADIIEACRAEREKRFRAEEKHQEMLAQKRRSAQKAAPGGTVARMGDGLTDKKAGSAARTEGSLVRTEANLKPIRAGQTLAYESLKEAQERLAKMELADRKDRIALMLAIIKSAD